MKLAIAMVLVALASTSVMAVELTGSVGYSRDKATAVSNTEYVVRAQDKNIGVQVTVGAIDRVEVDYTVQPMAAAKWFSVTAGMGAVTGDTPGNWTYAVEPKVTFALTDRIAADSGFKYRNSLKQDGNDMSKTWGAGVTYAINKQLSVGARYEDATGDQNTKTTYASLAYKF